MHILGVLGLVALFLLVNVYLAAIIYVCFGYAFYLKTWEDNDLLELLPAEWIIAVIGIVYVLFLWILKKIFQQKVYLVIFRVVAFLFGIIFISILILFWIFVIKSIFP